MQIKYCKTERFYRKFPEQCEKKESICQLLKFLKIIMMQKETVSCGPSELSIFLNRHL